jgi:hypothetical protein
VPQYAHAQVEFSAVKIDDLHLLPRSLERFKIFRLNRLADLRARENLPISFALEGSPWAVVPPIVERRADGSLVVIDGAHRVSLAAERQQEEIDVIVVSDVTAALPAQPMPLGANLPLTFERLPRDRRYNNLLIEQFRPIRSAFAQALRAAALAPAKLGTTSGR